MDLAVLSPDLLERDVGAALGEAHRAALALAGDRVGFRRVDVGQLHLAAELRRHRAELHGNARLEGVLGGPLNALAPGDGRLEHGRIVQGFPHALARGRDAPLSGHFHLVRSLIRSGAN
jgi:hypothetical protein